MSSQLTREDKQNDSIVLSDYSKKSAKNSLKKLKFAEKLQNLFLPILYHVFTKFFIYSMWCVCVLL